MDLKKEAYSDMIGNLKAGLVGSMKSASYDEDMTSESLIENTKNTVNKAPQQKMLKSANFLLLKAACSEVSERGFAEGIKDSAVDWLPIAISASFGLA
jgi:hypothetical protein